MGILTEDNNWVKGYPVVGGVWPLVAKPCDFCKSASALLFCKSDSAFLCVSCDARIHTANKLASRHERLWMCEVCEQVPASVTCKADAAALCISCDADIHSANPLSRKHDRVPLLPFYETAESIIKKNSSAVHSVNAGSGSNSLVNFLVPRVDEDDDQPEDLSWFTPPNKAVVSEAKTGGGGELIFSDFDHLLEFENPNQVYLNFKNNNQHAIGSVSVVPVQIKPESDRCFDIDFCKSKLPLYNFDTNCQSINHTVSSTSMDIGMVPDSIEIDNSPSAAAQATQLTGVDREARVLRYREKRKNRKFEKTIRYASRKAYAETRPRVKGRFVKRIEPESELDRLGFNDGSIDFFEGYGVVPSY